MGQSVSADAQALQLNELLSSDDPNPQTAKPSTAALAGPVQELRRITSELGSSRGRKRVSRMGAARSVEAETIPDEEPGAPEPDAGRPYFFVAACPVGQAEEAIATAGRYGGFHCLDEQGGGSDSDTAQALAKWKGQAQGQFSILQKLSPEGRKVVVVVVGGAGEQAEQARFLDRLSRRRGYEQLDVKRCRDVQDLERWLKASGYRRVQVLGLACRPLFSTLFTGGEPSPPRSTALPAVAEESPQAGEAEASHDRTKPWNPVASLMETDLSMLGGPFAARRERALSDCEMAVEVSRDVRSDDPQALRAAKVKLGAAISDAVAAGVKERDLQRAREREEELQPAGRREGRPELPLLPRGCARGGGAGGRGRRAARAHPEAPAGHEVPLRLRDEEGAAQRRAERSSTRATAPTTSTCGRTRSRSSSRRTPARRRPRRGPPAPSWTTRAAAAGARCPPSSCPSPRGASAPRGPTTWTCASGCPWPTSGLAADPARGALAEDKPTTTAEFFCCAAALRASADSRPVFRLPDNGSRARTSARVMAEGPSAHSRSAHARLRRPEPLPGFTPLVRSPLSLLGVLLLPALVLDVGSLVGLVQSSFAERRSSCLSSSLRHCCRVAADSKKNG
ncbi:unnamed protein product [Prorocentrum cordatum]|uniref:Uncharacterized protein n=1 Tax=Prorocentrum cordatum TaxID=2364126 RepID=A0ABN9UYM5_9DINO|nr:unnamed protein product [Polarella glacialis]